MPNETKVVPPYTVAREAIQQAVTEAEIIEAFEVYHATEGDIRCKAEQLNEELDRMRIRKEEVERELNDLSRNEFFRQTPVEAVAAEKVFKLRLAEWRENEDVT